MRRQRSVAGKGAKVSMTCPAAAPLELLPTSARAGIVLAGLRNSLWRGRRRVPNAPEHRSPEVRVLSQCVWNETQHRFGKLLERCCLGCGLLMKAFGETPGREETECHQHDSQFFIQVAWELHVPEFLQPFVSNQEAARPAGERRGVLGMPTTWKHESRRPWTPAPSI